MPLIFPGQSSGGGTPVPAATVVYNQAAQPIDYLLGIVPEISVTHNGDNEVSACGNQGVTRSETTILQATTDRKPIYNATGGLNGFPCLEFDGNKCLDIAGDGLEMAKAVGGMVIAIVHEPGEPTGDPQRLFQISQFDDVEGIKVAFNMSDNPYGERTIEVQPNDDYQFISTFFNPRIQPCCEFIAFDFINGIVRYYYNFSLVFEGTLTDIGLTANVSALACRVGSGIGSGSGVFWGYVGKITRFDVWSGANVLDPIYLADLAQTYTTKYFPTANVQNVNEMVYCAGDSNMEGYGDLEYNETIPWYLQENLMSPKPNTFVIPVAKADMPTRDALQFMENEKFTLARMVPVGAKNKTICFLGNTNDITLGIPAADIVANLTNFCQFYKANGFRIVGSNTLPRGDSTPLNDATTALNVIIAATWSAIGFDSFINAHDAVSLLTDFQDDDVHLNAAGAEIVGALFKTAIEALTNFSLPIFQDEFPGSTLNTDKWITTLAWGGRNNPATGEEQWYADENVTVADGELTLTATDDETEPGYPYTSGVIETYGKWSQTYGYFEGEMLLPAGNGAWPAFWLLPTPIDWPPEIDGMENGGKDPNVMYCSFHFIDGNGDVDFVTVAIDTPDLSADYFKYGFEWRLNRLSFFLNGANIANITLPYIPAQPMYIIANLAIGSNWADIGFPDETTPWPMEVKIRYIRSWA